MSELTDLELNKKIAEIDGVEVYEEDNQFYGHVLFRKQRVAGLGPEVYDPARNWNITGPLMVKHKISHYATLGNAFKQYRAFYEYITEDDEIERFTVMHKDLQRAILLAIVAKFEAAK